MLRIMKDGLPGDLCRRIGFGLMTCIRVARKVREIAARNLHPDAVTGFKKIAGGAKVDGNWVGFSGSHQLGLFERIAVAYPKDSVREIHREAVWIEIHQFDCKIGIGSAA